MVHFRCLWNDITIGGEEEIKALISELQKILEESKKKKE